MERNRPQHPCTCSEQCIYQSIYVCLVKWGNSCDVTTAFIRCRQFEEGAPSIIEEIDSYRGGPFGRRWKKFNLPLRQIQPRLLHTGRIRLFTLIRITMARPSYRFIILFLCLSLSRFSRAASWASLNCTEVSYNTLETTREPSRPLFVGPNGLYAYTPSRHCM